MKYLLRTITVLAATGVITCGANASLPAQDADALQDDSNRRSAAESIVRFYRIEHGVADEIGEIIRELRGVHGMIVVDERTNSLIINAPVQDQERAAELIRVLDVESPEEEQFTERIVRVFDVADLATFVSLDQLVPVMVTERHERIAFETDQMMIVSGDESTMVRVEHLLSMIRHQQEAAQGNTSQRRLRVIWLVSGLDAETSRDVPTDLREVTKELAALGIHDLRLAAQSIIEIRTGEPFEMSSIAQIVSEISGELSMRFNIEGFADQTVAGDSRIDLNVVAQTSGILLGSSVESSIVAPTGHSIVLAVTPMVEMQSVFVIQVHED